jgi:hypothetical protein
MPNLGVKSLLILASAVCGTWAESPIDKSMVITVPLDQMWAYQMPGTGDIEKLNKSVPADELDMRLMHAVLELSFERAARSKFSNAPRPGFAVAGNGRSALHAAIAVFLDWGARRVKFSSEDEITIVFFSEFISRYPVQIREVERKDNRIEVQYELVPDINWSSHINLALIPLGKLPAGEYRIELRQLPRKLKPVEVKLGFQELDKEWSRNFLCKPFSFKVEAKARVPDDNQ